MTHVIIFNHGDKEKEEMKVFESDELLLRTVAEALGFDLLSDPFQGSPKKYILREKWKIITMDNLPEEIKQAHEIEKDK